MSAPMIEIVHRCGEVLYKHETTEERLAIGLAMRDAMEAACKARTCLAGADLAGANLAGADLAGADLTGSNLVGADLACSNLAGASLAFSNLAGADLFGSCLAGADLADANLAGAYIDGAKLAGAKLADGAKLVGKRPVLMIGPIGSRGAHLTAFITDAGVRIHTGCFFGAVSDFEAACEKTHGDNKHAREYRAALALIAEHAAIWEPTA